MRTPYALWRFGLFESVLRCMPPKDDVNRSVKLASCQGAAQLIFDLDSDFPETNLQRVKSYLFSTYACGLKRKKGVDKPRPF